MAAVSVYFLISEVFSSDFHYFKAFVLFLLSEVGIFATLFVTTLWAEDVYLESISDWGELPFLGCFLLIGSSITATAYHHKTKDYVMRRILLQLTIFLGVCFVGLQL